MIEIEIIELGLFPFIGGWLSTAVQVGASIFGGMSARRKARARKRRMTNAINEKKELLSSQVPNIDKYYDNLDDMLLADYSVDLDRTIEDFSKNVFSFTTQAEGAVSQGKGLISGTVNKSIAEGKAEIQSGTGRSLDDLAANYDKTVLQMDNARQKELTAIDSALADLDIQLSSLG
tara:strand:+ start:899 stop:1426 length:528 start_codon:yes stop_codon:yes gene_type:complete